MLFQPSLPLCINCIDIKVILDLICLYSIVNNIYNKAKSKKLKFTFNQCTNCYLNKTEANVFYLIEMGTKKLLQVYQPEMIFAMCCPISAIDSLANPILPKDVLVFLHHLRSYDFDLRAGIEHQKAWAYFARGAALLGFFLIVVRVTKI